MNRESRATLGQDTVRILEEGSYQLPSGKAVELRAAIDACVAATCFWTPEALSELEAQTGSRSQESPARIDVTSETTLQGAHRLLASDGGRVAALNFASARNPGGGFLGGSQAQEESLARSSALYASLTCEAAQPYYTHHRGERSALYSDRMIVSPDCPVFRDDDGALRDEPFAVTFITSAAPNAGAIARNDPAVLPQVEAVFRERIRKMLGLAAQAGCKRLVLGAWGCGVFGNDPRVVARLFAEALSDTGPHRHRFEAIRFSIHDSAPGQPVLAAFREALAP